MTCTKPWILWELNIGTNLTSYRHYKRALCNSPQRRGSSVHSHVCRICCILVEDRGATVQDQTPCPMLFWFFICSNQSSPYPLEQTKKANKYWEDRCISSQLQHFFSMWSNFPIKSVIKSLDPLGLEPGETSSSAELHAPFRNSWTKDIIPPVQ